MITYEHIILLSWVVFIVVWAVMSFNIKRDVRGGFSSVWQQYWVLRLIAAAFLVFLATRVATGTAHFTSPRLILGKDIFTPPVVLGWIAALLSVIGVSVAVWARVNLGRNWSARPAAKENHELVTSGPYAYVRHPIYTGLLIVALGTALSGSFFGVYVIVFASIVFLFRIRKEEKIMLELFPDTYPSYQARTKKLIPFIW